MPLDLLIKRHFTAGHLTDQSEAVKSAQWSLEKQIPHVQEDVRPLAPVENAAYPSP